MTKMLQLSERKFNTVMMIMLNVLVQETENMQEDRDKPRDGNVNKYSKGMLEVKYPMSKMRKDLDGLSVD